MTRIAALTHRTLRHDEIHCDTILTALARSYRAAGMPIRPAAVYSDARDISRAMMKGDTSIYGQVVEDYLETLRKIETECIAGCPYTNARWEESPPTEAP